MKKEFYVGYLPNAPENLGQWLKKTISYVVVILILGSVVFGISQEQLPGITFEYGEYSEVSGFIVKSPFPTLYIPSPDGKTYKSILLVNFGKLGAQGLVENWAISNQGLDGKMISLRGTLIYYDGISVLELSEEEASLIRVESTQIAFQEPQEVIIGSKTLSGEILDTKCFFGVMNPGHGKTHRSCAIRCISGGIPPIFGSNMKDRTFYGIVTGPNGMPVNDQILSIVGKTQELEGVVTKRGDLKYFKLSSDHLASLNQNETPLLDDKLALCQQSLGTNY